MYIGHCVMCILYTVMSWSCTYFPQYSKCRADRSSQDDQITGVVNPITLSKTEATSQIVHIDDLDDLEEEDVVDVKFDTEN